MLFSFVGRGRSLTIKKYVTPINAVIRRIDNRSHICFLMGLVRRPADLNLKMLETFILV